MINRLTGYHTVFITVIVWLFFAGCGIFKLKSVKKSSKAEIGVAPKSTDSVKTVAIPKGPKKFSGLIGPQATVDSGIFNIYKQDDRYFLELKDSLLGRDLLIVSRISRSAADNRNNVAMLGYGGDQINENVIRFEKSALDKLLIRSISFVERLGDSSQTMYRSVSNSNIQPIVAAFDIKAFSKNEDGSVIEVTDFLNGDNDLLFFSGSIKGDLKLSAYQTDKSYISGIRSYPSNVEIRTVKTYGKIASPTGFATYELNTSMVLLPKVPMRSRRADARVGYFTRRYTDYNSNPQGIDKVDMITRWRLEPRPADVARYLAGELVEPAKPIVFYIDPATPRTWIPYLIQGVTDWNVAFEKAGFKNAIMAKPAPSSSENSDWSLEDARHSAIVYKSSDIPNASGPHVHDPRSGEILETHINWYHNVMELLRNWYMIQVAAIDPKARKMFFDEKLMGQLIRSVSSHEVGHTLGLLHNFGSSSTVPVEKLRDKAWVEANGHTPSIMDYARFNYVAQPEDGISEKGIFPKINDYDMWAIEWGYRWYPADRFTNVEEERDYLNKWVINRTSANSRLWFGAETDPDDPRSQNEDLGDDAMKAGAYGIKNLQRVLPKLQAWTNEPNADYSGLSEMYRQLLQQYAHYMTHVVKNIGGVKTTPKTREETGKIIEYVSKTRQRQAMAFLQEHLFKTPLWLLDKNVFEKTRNGSIFTIINQQDAILSRLLSPGLIYKLCQFEGAEGALAYRPKDMMGDLQSGIFKELRSGARISIYRRNLQKSYVEKMLNLLHPPVASMGSGVAIGMAGPNIRTTDVLSVVKMKLKELQHIITTASVNDNMTKAHLQDLNDRIDDVLKRKG